MRKKLIIIIFIIGICTGCSNINSPPIDEELQTTNGPQQVNDFDFDSSVAVIQRTLGCSETKAKSIVNKIQESGINFVVDGRISDEYNDLSFDVVCEISCKDSCKYLLYLDENFLLFAIKDLQTLQFLYAIIM